MDSTPGHGQWVRAAWSGALHGEDFAKALEHVPVPAVFVGPDGRYQHANAWACDLLRRPLEEFLGRHVLDFAAPGTEGRMQELFRQLAAGKRCDDQPLDVVRGDGTITTVRLTRHPVFDDQGDFVGACGVLVEDQSATAQDRVSDQVRATALASVLNAVMVTDVDGVILWVNDAFERMSGYTPEEAIGQTPRLLKSGRQSETHYEQLWATILDRRVWTGDVVERRKDGGLYSVRQTITPILGARGEVTHFVAVHEDVTELQGHRARLEALFEHSLDAILFMGEDGRILAANPAAFGLIGRGRDDLVGQPLTTVLSSDDPSAQVRILQDLAENLHVRDSLRVHRADGSVRDVDVQAAADILDGVHLLVVRDVTEQRRAEAHQQFQAHLLEAVAEAVLATDDRGRIRYVNPAAEALFGEVSPDLVGRLLAPVLGLDHAPGGLHVPSRLDLPGRTSRDVLIRTSTYRDGEAHGTIAVVTDVSDLEHARSQVDHMATHDVLTGLPNRTLFVDRLEQQRATAERHEGRFAVLLCDLDAFKLINDAVGHATGDQVLQQVARALVAAASPDCTVARLGGDEFAVLCPGITDPDVALQAAEQQVHAALQRITVPGHAIAITASIGIVLGDGSSDAASLLRDADAAMYAAKDAGRNRTQVFDAQVRVRARKRFDASAAIAAALESDGVEVHYQPIMDLVDGSMVGVEALVRLRNPDGTLVPPDQFIPVAEETGMIVPLGEHVLRAACQDAVSWVATQPGFHVSVNVAAHQVLHPSLAANIEKLLVDTGLEPAALWLEITESALLAGPDVAAALERLQATGVWIAIDDFGTGYSSLAHLRELPADILKIDRSFVAGMLGNDRDRALVGLTIDLARAFGLPTVAEGVETPEQANLLVDLGCTLAQGYLFAPPVTAWEITQMIGTSGPGHPGR